MKVAALDLGSNSFLCLIAEVENGAVTKVYSDLVKVVRLGQGLGKEVKGPKKFHPEALERAKKCLQEFAVEIKRHHPEKILAMATAAARDVENQFELKNICDELGIPMQIIPGEKEAQITYQGSIAGHVNHDTVAVVDLGGGSTELIVGNAKEIFFAESVNIGVVKFKEFELTESHEQLQLKLSTLFSHAASEVRKNSPTQVIAVAGTPTSLAAMEIGQFDAQKIDGYRLTKTKLKQWISELAPLSGKEIADKYCVDPGRADVICGGAKILLEVLDQIDVEEYIVSTKGVRYGVALEMAK